MLAVPTKNKEVSSKILLYFCIVKIMLILTAFKKKNCIIIYNRMFLKPKQN